MTDTGSYIRDGMIVAWRDDVLVTYPDFGGVMDCNICLHCYKGVPSTHICHEFEVHFPENLNTTNRR